MKFTFTGEFYITANSMIEAARHVRDHCGLVIGGDIHSTLPDEDINWNFPVHPDKTILNVKQS